HAARAGYAPAGLRDFLRAVQDSGSQPAKSGFLAKFTSTHPGAVERLKEQDTQLKTAPAGGRRNAARTQQAVAAKPATPARWNRAALRRPPRSEEHTSELQSRGQLVCR